jgi:hypothetical protein
MHQRVVVDGSCHSGGVVCGGNAKDAAHVNDGTNSSRGVVESHQENST